MRVVAPLLFALLSLGAIGIDYVLQVSDFEQRVEADERRRLTERLGVEQTYLQLMLDAGDAVLPALRQAVATLALRPGVTHAYLVDGRRRVVASMLPQHVGDSLEGALANEPPAIREALKGTLARPALALSAPRPETPLVLRVVDENDALIGQVRLRDDGVLVVRLDLAARIAERRQAGQRELWRQAGLIALFAALVYVLLDVLWLRRAARLTEVVAAMGAGDLRRRAGLRGGDELARIGAEVDRMAQQLQARQGDLQRLSTLINRSPVVAIEWRDQPGLPVAYVSDGVAQWGYQRDDLLSGRIVYADLIHRDDRPNAEQEVRDHIAHGPDEYRHEYRLRAADGRWIWVEDLTWLARDAAGRVNGIYGVLLDVSARHQAEAALWQEKRLLEHAEAHARLGSWELDVASGKWRWSIQMYALLGMDASRDVPSLRACLATLHEDDRERVHEAISELEAGNLPAPLGLVRSAEGRGETKWFAPTVHGENDAGGRLVRVSGTLLDVTELHRGETALRESEARYRELFESNPLPMYIYDIDTLAILAVNGAAVAHYGYDQDEFLAMRVSALSPPEDVAAAIGAMARGAQAGRQDVGVCRHVLKDGGIIEVELVVHALDSPGRRASLVLANDVTERLMAEREVRQLNAELEQRVAQRTAQLEAANKELRAFSYSVSHDLKAPLRGIDGYSQLLYEDYGKQLDEQGRLFLDSVRKGVAQMHELIADMLAYSRMERTELSQRPVCLATLFDAVVASRESELRRGGVELIRRVEDLELHADREGLMLILRNLFDNAIKFSGAVAAPSIEVGARRDGDEVTLWVRDNGVGFDMKYHDRIFEIFQRLQRAEDYAGTGIGLAMVKKAVQRMGGRVWGESRPGEGAAFFVVLPAGGADEGLAGV